MRKRYFLTAVFFASLLFSNTLFSQSDTLDVPASTTVGYLNNVIIGDTTATGARVNLKRVYRLQRASIYWISTEITTRGWDLNIVGAEDNPAKPSYPPIIAFGIMQDGRNAARIASVDGNLTLKNLYISGINQNNVQQNNGFEIYKDDAVVKIDKCNFEWFRLHCYWVHSKNTSVYITNSFFRNNSNNTGPFNGRLGKFDDLATNEVVMQNNTFVNFQSFMFSIRFNTCKFFKFDHNTIVNQVKWPFHSEYHTNAEITNNIFYNSSSYGENNADASTQDPEKLQYGIVNLISVPDTMLAKLGMKESDRRVVVKNNLFFFDKDVEAWLAKWNTGTDPVKKSPWMNSRTSAMFANKTAYPKLESKDPIIEDPVFVKAPPSASMLTYMEDRRGKGTSTVNYSWDEDGVMIANNWPLPEKLNYSTTSKAYTAGDGGFPLGDLNWFPDKKAQWITDVKSNNEIPLVYSLEQNYPNPFNPSTKIKFSIPSNANVKLKVYNVLGQEVAVLVNEYLNAGGHQCDFNASSLTSGVYIYKLEAGNYAAAKKMLLVK